ncbi:hypothetical protein [Ruminococcus sp. NK3A76]|uniref:hypothetical protein n=1 Tax=Ruminococcus sp. NK3A76 TaxID=877411 RepID=UPI00048D5536|nr:hypothetical protein [Ruminococcus sp. NK3A76]
MTTKRILAGIMAAVLALGLVSCGEENESSSESKAEISPASGAADSTGSVADSSDSAKGGDEESSDDEGGTPDISLDDGGFELMQALIGMDTETARELISELFDDLSGTENDDVPNENMKRYDYEGRIELFGGKYECIYLLTDENGGGVIEGVGLIYGFGHGKEGLLPESDVRTQYEAFKEAVEGEYGRVKTDVSIEGDTTTESSRWEEQRIESRFVFLNEGYANLKVTFGKGYDEYTKAQRKKPDTPEAAEPDVMLDVKESLELCKKVFAAGKEGYQQTIEDALGITLDSTLYGNADRNEPNMHSVAFRTDQLAQSYSGSVLGIFGEKFTSLEYDYDAHTKQTLRAEFYFSMKDYLISEEVYKSAEDCAEAYNSILPKLAAVLGEPDETYNGSNSTFDWEEHRWENTGYGFDVQLFIEKDTRSEAGPGELEVGFYNNVTISVSGHEELGKGEK